MKILVTGPFGQIGSELIPALQEKHGKKSVIALGHKRIPDWYDGPLEKGDVRDKEILANIIEKHDITVIYHLAGILSAKGETMPDETWAINVDSLKLVLDLARDKKLQVFWASSIAVFGPTTPREKTPQRTILEPTTMYGATKLAGEALCHYYNEKWGVDVRSIRYPGLISWKAPPGGGTTDYAVAIFHGALKEKKYECFVSEETILPMMYMSDGIKAILQLMEADPEKLTVRTSYNLGAISFRADELAEEIKKRIPEFECTYKPDQRQAIANSWPQSVDDSQAKKDWGWQHEFNLQKMTDVMLENLKKQFGGE